MSRYDYDKVDAYGLSELDYEVFADGNGMGEAYRRNRDDAELKAQIREQYDAAMDEFADWQTARDERVIVYGSDPDGADDYRMADMLYDMQYIDHLSEDGRDWDFGDGPRNEEYFRAVYDAVSAAKRLDVAASALSDNKMCLDHVSEAADVLSHMGVMDTTKLHQQFFHDHDFDTVRKHISHEMGGLSVLSEADRAEVFGRPEDYGFDERLDFCVREGLPWTAETNVNFNKDIRAEWERIQEEAYRDSIQHDWLIAQADTIEDIREQDGIVGDEPDIPYYEARAHAFGKSVEELRAEADEFGESVGRNYEEARDDFFERIYNASRVEWDDVPAVTRDNPQSMRYGITRETYDALGDEYQRFYEDKVGSYAKAKVAENNKLMGIDLSRSPAPAQPQPAKQSEAQVESVREASVERAVEKPAVSHKTPRRMPKGSEDVMRADRQQQRSSDDLGDK